ncbi:MAG: hypothetical protein R3181_06715 [Rubricoccaceae bacterium]|nr:hypothetical protein [Rubricoccaceae bacterium]
MRTTSLALLLSLGAAAAAQDTPTVAPGSELLDLGRLQPGSTTYTVTAVQGAMRQQVGTFVQTLSVDDAAGVAETVSELTVMGQKFTDTMRVAWPSLAARYHRSENPQRLLVFAVEDGRLVGEHTPTGGTAEAFEMSVDGPVFDSAWLDDVARALPLAEGYTATLTAYNHDAGGLADYTLRVAGSEKVAREGKASVDAWVVEVEQPDQDELPRFYLSKEDHALVRIQVEPQPGVQVLIDAE